MTISPDTPPNIRPDRERSPIREGDFSQRADETSARSAGIKTAWVLFIILFAVAGIYVLVTLFSIGVEILSDGTPKQAAEREEQRQNAPLPPPQPGPVEK